MIMFRHNWMFKQIPVLEILGLVIACVSMYNMIYIYRCYIKSVLNKINLFYSKSPLLLQGKQLIYSFKKRKSETTAAALVFILTYLHACHILLCFQFTCFTDTCSCLLCQILKNTKIWCIFMVLLSLKYSNT